MKRRNSLRLSALIALCLSATALGTSVHASDKYNFKQWKKNKGQQVMANMKQQIIVKYKDDADLESLSQDEIPTQARGLTDSNNTLGKRLARKLKKRSKKRVRHLRKLKNKMHLFEVERDFVTRSSAVQLNVDEAIQAVSADANVEYAEQDAVRYFMSQVEPWGISRVQADLVSDSNAGNMTVCIIDSGYEYANPDINANNATGTNNSGTGNWYQAGGSHGTHVAGTIAGVSNDIGVVGVLPNTTVNLHIVKVFNADGWGYSSDLVSAVQTCAQNGSNVVNMSLGGPNATASERNGLAAIANQGVLLIAAAGNDGNTELSYPASYDSVMAVGALDENNQHARFSQATSQVEISAPGEAVLSTVAGDGRLGYITVNGVTTANDRVVPQTRYVNGASGFSVQHFNGTATGALGRCTLSGSSYNCNDVAGNICLVERNGNQAGVEQYPEINAVSACTDAGASGVIVYSNSERPGLQNPFLVDANNVAQLPVVSVNRTTGQSLISQLGLQTTLQVVGNQDYSYYNGTSMATPHVAGVAALAWSQNPSCTADQVRTALKETAIDVDSAGRDNRTGFGLVQTKAAADYLAGNCVGDNGGNNGGGSDTVLVNDQAKTGLSGSANGVLNFTLEVPAGATDLSFAMSGGSGDADLYVRFGAAATSSTYDCRPYLSGNNETCTISNVQAGTYYVSIVGYTSFSGVQLVGSFTEPSTGGNTGGTASAEDLSATRNNWLRYTIDIPAGMSTLEVAISGGSGDADLYLKSGSQPSTSSYDCRPYETGNNEVCTITNPTAGTWHIGLRAYSTFSGVDLNLSYQP